MTMVDVVGASGAVGVVNPHRIWAQRSEGDIILGLGEVELTFRGNELSELRWLLSGNRTEIDRSDGAFLRVTKEGCDYLVTLGKGDAREECRVEASKFEQFRLELIDDINDAEASRGPTRPIID